MKKYLLLLVIIPFCAEGMSSRIAGAVVSLQNSKAVQEDAFSVCCEKEGVIAGFFDGLDGDAVSKQLAVEYSKPFDAASSIEEQIKERHKAVENIFGTYSRKYGGASQVGAASAIVHIDARTKGVVCYHVGDVRVVGISKDGKLVAATTDHHAGEPYDSQVYPGGLTKFLGFGAAKGVSRTAREGDRPDCAELEKTIFPKEVEFVVAATDGLWWALDSANVAEFVSKCYINEELFRCMKEDLSLNKASNGISCTYARDDDALRNMRAVFADLVGDQNFLNPQDPLTLMNNGKNAWNGGAGLLAFCPWNQFVDNFNNLNPNCTPLSAENIKARYMQKFNITEQEFDARFPLDQIPKKLDIPEEWIGPEKRDKKCFLMAHSLTKYAKDGHSTDNITIGVFHCNSMEYYTWPERLANRWHSFSKIQKIVLSAGSSSLIMLLAACMYLRFR